MLRAEFTVFPFIEAEDVPPHVQAAIDELHKADLDVDVGPLSQIVSGEDEVVLDAVRAAEGAALAAGATKLVIDLELWG